ncbi:hypothetical protein ACU4GD_41490 [Cupriavidus basilensis]
MRFSVYQESRGWPPHQPGPHGASRFTRDALLMVLADGLGGPL